MSYMALHDNNHDCFYPPFGINKLARIHGEVILIIGGGSVGGWVMVGVQGKVAFWIKAFLYILF